MISSAAAQDSIRVAVEAEKTDFLLGEPVAVYVTITNTGTQDIRVYSEVGPEYTECKYLITDPDGNTRTFSPTIIAEPDDLRTLGQNQSVKGGAQISYGGEGYYFPKPGNYEVVVHYKGFQSDPLQLTVLSPQNEAEREQADLVLDHPEVGLFLALEGGDFLEDAMAQIETLSGKYPNSLITSYMLYAKAKNLSVPARNFTTGNPRDADYPGAISILNTIKDRNLPLFYQGRIFGTLSHSLEKTGRKNEAIETYREFQRKLELNERLKPFHIEKIQKELRRLQ
jgi:hypothetical protein